MDFLVLKFSEWLRTSHITHKISKFEDGYILYFIHPDKEFKKLISSLTIKLKTNKIVNQVAIATTKRISATGELVYITKSHYGEILNALQPAIRDYLNKYTHKEIMHE